MTNDWKALKRHPLSAEYRDLKGKAKSRLRDGLKSRGFLPDRPITLHDGMVLDGWQRQCECVALDIEPAYQDLPAGWEPEEYVEDANDARRHESPEIIEKRAKERRGRVAERKRAGESNRTIADAEGVSEKQVRRDLEAATASGDAVQPPDGKVMSKDGIKRPATKDIGDAHEDPILCKRCHGIGRETPPGGCSRCKDMREKSAKAASNKKGSRAGAQKNGQAKYRWDDFRNAVGHAYREIDKLGKLYGAKESLAAAKLRDQLGEFEASFKEWLNSLTKAKV